MEFKTVPLSISYIVNTDESFIPVEIYGRKAWLVNNCRYFMVMGNDNFFPCYYDGRSEDEVSYYHIRHLKRIIN